MIYPLFVYGTLKRDAIRSNRLAHLLDGSRRATDVAQVVGYKLYESRAGFPFIYPSHDLEIVYGELVWLQPERYDEMIKRLDVVEGVPDLYLRLLTPVLYHQGVQNAWMYVATSASVKDLPVIENGVW